MPHAVIEYSDNLEREVRLADPVNLVHGLLMESGLFDLNAIKTRMTGHDNWMVGEAGQDGTFVHLRVSIMTGRTLEQRQGLSDTLIAALGEMFPDVDQVTVEICEMERATYRKFKR